MYIKKIELQEDPKKHQSLYGRAPKNPNNNLFPKENQNKIVVPEVKEDPPKSEFEVLFSVGFLSVYLIAAVKGCTNFMFSGLFKEFGMYFVKDDLFTSQCAIIGIFLNLITRFFMGKITEKLGIKWVYVLNMVLELLCSSTIYFFGGNKIGFFFFIAFSRVSSGNYPLRLIPSCFIYFELCFLFRILGRQNRISFDEIF